MTAEEYNKRRNAIEAGFAKTIDSVTYQKAIKELDRLAETELKAEYNKFYDDIIRHFSPQTMLYVTTGRSASKTPVKTGLTLEQHKVIALTLKTLFYHPCKTKLVGTLRIKIDRYRSHLAILCGHEYPRVGYKVYY